MSQRVLAEVGGDPDRPYREPIAWVQIVELPDGNFGTFGRVMSVSDMVDFAANGEVPVRGTAGKGRFGGQGNRPRLRDDCGAGRRRHQCGPRRHHIRLLQR